MGKNIRLERNNPLDSIFKLFKVFLSTTFTYSHASSRKKSIYSHPSMFKHIQVYMFLFNYHFEPLWFHYIEFTVYLLHIYLLNDLFTLRQLMMEAWQLPKRDFLAMETRSLPKRVLSAL